MQAMVIYDGPGPLYLTANFTAPADGPVVFFLTGTTRTANAAGLTGINLLLDENVIGSSMCWANANDNHMTMRPNFINVDLTSGDHVIELTNGTDITVTDVNDYFQVVLLY